MLDDADKEWIAATVNAATEKLIAALRGSAPTTQRTAGGGSASGGMTLPPYGRNKSQPIAGQAIADLEYYAAGCRRTLDDPGKQRWHDKERVLLAAIEAEIARQGGSAPTGGDGGFNDGGDDSIPF